MDKSKRKCSLSSNKWRNQYFESTCLFDQSFRCSLSRSWSNSWVIPTNNALFGCNRLTAAKLCKNINQTTLLHISQPDSALSMVLLYYKTWLQTSSFHMLLNQLKIIQIRKITINWSLPQVNKNVCCVFQPEIIIKQKSMRGHQQ